MRFFSRFARRIRSRHSYAVLAMLFAVSAFSSQTARGMLGSVAANAAGLLDARSPGARGAGAVQTKHPRQRVAAAPRRVPHSRVLSETRTRPTPGAAPGALPPDDIPAAQPEGAASGPAGAEGVPAGAGPLPLTAESLPPGGNPILTNEIASPVPEPDTYALFALGIGLIGGLQRRRRAARRALSGREVAGPALP